MLSAAWAGDWPITQPWGCTDVAVEPWYAPSGCHFHCGVDIGMPSGTRLYALRSGIVVKRTLGILGIATASKEVDYYIHGAYPVLLGTIVKAGQSIGLSGNIQPGGGYTTGPHLHYERQSAGGFLNEPSTSLDPLPILDPQTYSGGGGTITPDDMTPDEHNWLEALYKFISNPKYTHFDQGFTEILTAVEAIPGGAAEAPEPKTVTLHLPAQDIKGDLT